MTILLFLCATLGIKGTDNNSNTFKQKINIQKNQDLPINIRNQLYYACQMGKRDKIDDISTEYGEGSLNSMVENCSKTPDLPIEIAIRNKQWEIVL